MARSETDGVPQPSSPTDRVSQDGGQTIDRTLDSKGHSRPEVFEWPPREETLTNMLYEFRNQSMPSVQHHPATVPSPVVSPRGQPEVAPELPVVPRAEPALQQRPSPGEREASAPQDAPAAPHQESAAAKHEDPVPEHVDPLQRQVDPAPQQQDPASEGQDPPSEEEEPYLALRRVLEEREASTPKVPEKQTHLSIRPLPAVSATETPLRSRALAIALVAFALIAVVEGIYILRTASQPPADRTTSSEANASALSGASGPERAAVLPENAGPTPQKEGSKGSGAGALGTTGALAAKGRLVIRSEPSGARIQINGRSHGVTPATLENVWPGEYRILLTRDGTELRQTVKVEPGATVSVVAPLQPGGGGRTSGWMAIASPIEVDVLEEGALLGTSRSRQIMLEAGPHTLQLVNENLGYKQVQQVRIEAGKLARVNVELPRSTINLNAMPWAEVWIDGKAVGETPIGNLPIVIGTHEVVFRHPDLGEKTMSAVVKAGVPTRLTADLRQQPSTGR